MPDNIPSVSTWGWTSRWECGARTDRARRRRRARRGGSRESRGIEERRGRVVHSNSDGEAALPPLVLHSRPDPSPPFLYSARLTSRSLNITGDAAARYRRVVTERFEWDGTKARANARRHSVSFPEAASAERRFVSSARAGQPEKSGERMNKHRNEGARPKRYRDGICAEYDFSTGKRGVFRKRFPTGVTLIALDEDVSSPPLPRSTRRYAPLQRRNRWCADRRSVAPDAAASHFRTRVRS